MPNATFPDRESIASKLNTLDESAQSWLSLIMENPAQDEALLEGLLFFLNESAQARFLNALKLGKAGEWLGQTAPARLQVHFMEAAKSSQNPAYGAFREGLIKSGGLERAYPKSDI